MWKKRLSAVYLYLSFLVYKTVSNKKIPFFIVFWSTFYQNAPIPRIFGAHPISHSYACRFMRQISLIFWSKDDQNAPAFQILQL